MGYSDPPTSILSGRQPATSVYADGRSPDDVIAFGRGQTNLTTPASACSLTSDATTGKPLGRPALVAAAVASVLAAVLAAVLTRTSYIQRNAHTFSAMHVQRW